MSRERQDVYAYCRENPLINSERYKIETQKREIGRYCEKNGIDVTDWIVDISTLADMDERDGIEFLLTVAPEGSSVIVTNTAVLWDDEYGMIEIRRAILEKNLKIISLEQPDFKINEKDPNTFLINRISEIMSRFVEYREEYGLRNGGDAE